MKRRRGDPNPLPPRQAFSSGQREVGLDSPVELQHLLLVLLLLLLLLFLPQESLLEEEPRGRDVHAVCATIQTRDGEKRSPGARASRVLHNHWRHGLLQDTRPPSH